LLLQLRLRERRELPPTFFALLDEIKEAEKKATACHKLKASVKPIQLRQDGKLDSSVIKQLQADIQRIVA